MSKRLGYFRAETGFVAVNGFPLVSRVGQRLLQLPFIYEGGPVAAVNILFPVTVSFKEAYNWFAYSAR